MESVARAWLTRQCELIPGAAQGVLVLGAAASGSPAPAALWPGGAKGNPSLIAAANAALSQGRVVINGQAGSPGSPSGNRQIAVPIQARGLTGAVAVEIDQAAQTKSREAVDLLRSGAGWLELLNRGDAVRDRLVTVVELIGLGLEHERFRAAATALATELATRLGFERVSIGFVARGQMRVEALSHSAKFDDRANLIRDLGLAMDEAWDQDATIVHPAPAAAPAQITRAHEQLVRGHGAGAVCTVPLASGGRIVGALTCERPAGGSLEPDTIPLCEDVATILGPILQLKRGADARLLERVREFLRSQLANLFGPDHSSLKVGAAAVVAALLVLAFAKGDYRVKADATLEGRVQRAIVAGIEGYIAEANARAGDLVQEGQILGRLDERDLILERREWSARRAQFRSEYREALAAHDRTQVNILGAKIAQADAQLELLDQQLERTRLIAPFDGVVVEGDLSQSLGSPVTKGEVLFEVAPLEGYRIILKVDERDISDVAEGERGQLVLSAMADRSLPFTVERVTPISTAEDGRNHFRVEARLEHPVESLRPGMEGVAKIEVEPRRLTWIWTHHLVDWLRLWAWSWWP